MISISSFVTYFKRSAIAKAIALLLIQLPSNFQYIQTQSGTEPCDAVPAIVH